MRKPLIGVTCGIHHEKSGTVFYGSLPAYTSAIEAAGGLPLLIVPKLNAETLRELYDRVDGVLMTGGGDVDPVLYGVHENTDVELRGVDTDRDATEISLTRWASEEDKPLFGICRGIQVMNVALGGTLYRDIAHEYDQRVNHDLGSKESRNHEGHAIEIRQGSRLAEAIGETTIAVNTMHHQAIRNLGHNLLPVATSPDGLIEGVEREGARFFVGVQWHPEELYTYSEPMRHLFEGFIKQAAS